MPARLRRQRHRPRQGRHGPAPERPRAHQAASPATSRATRQVPRRRAGHERRRRQRRLGLGLAADARQGRHDRHQARADHDRPARPLRRRQHAVGHVPRQRGVPLPQRPAEPLGLGLGDRSRDRRGEARHRHGPLQPRAGGPLARRLVPHRRPRQPAVPLQVRARQAARPHQGQALRPEVRPRHQHRRVGRPAGPDAIPRPTWPRASGPPTAANSFSKHEGIVKAKRGNGVVFSESASRQPTLAASGT